MITFGAKYISSGKVEKAVKRERLSYKSAFVEFKPQSTKDSLTMGLTSCLIHKRTGFTRRIRNAFSNAETGDIGNNNWVRFYGLTKEQSNYKFVKPGNIFGLVEISSRRFDKNTIYINYIQAIKH